MHICYDRGMEIEQGEFANGHSALDAASRNLFQLGRAFGRLPMRELLATDAGRAPELSAILVVQAVEEIARSRREATIGAVAAQLGIDPSTASRLVAQSVQSGLLRRDASQSDGRVRSLDLSEAGRGLAADAARYQRAVFDAATAEWTAEERETFAHLFAKFAGAIVAALNEDHRM
jgi:DNA-binding MarR family transcriptional regulator